MSSSGKKKSGQNSKKTSLKKIRLGTIGGGAGGVATPGAQSGSHQSHGPHQSHGQHESLRSFPQHQSSLSSFGSGTIVPSSIAGTSGGKVSTGLSL